MDNLLVLRVSLQEKNYNKCSDVENSGVEVSFWYWMENNYECKDTIKYFNKTY